MSRTARAAWLAPLAVLGPVLVLVTTRHHGLNISKDSTFYLAAADGLAGGEGVVGVDDRPMSLYAPGLPALLALPARLGLAEDAARWLNLGVLAALLGLVGWWLSRVVRLPVALGATALLAVSAPLVKVHVWLWSEPAFVLLTTLWLGLLVRIARSDGAVRRLVVLAGLLAGLATLVRYSGISLVPTAVAVLLTRAGPVRRRIGDVAVFGAVHGLPVLAWLVRNLLVTGAVTGERAPNAAGPLAIARKGLHTVSTWFVPAATPDPLQIPLVVLLLAAVAALARTAVRRRPAPDDPRRTVLLVAPTYLVLTFAAMVAMTSRTNVDPLVDRLLVPLVIPLVVALAALVDLAVDGLPRRRAVALGAAALVACGATSLGTVAVQAWLGGRELKSYNAASWQRKEPAVDRLVAAVPAGRPAMSNQPQAVRYLSGTPVLDSPRTTFYASTVTPPQDLPRLAALVKDGPVYLVWVGDERRPGYHRPASSLGALFDLDEVARTRAGTVYRLSRIDGAGLRGTETG